MNKVLVRKVYNSVHFVPKPYCHSLFSLLLLLLLGLNESKIDYREYRQFSFRRHLAKLTSDYFLFVRFQQIAW